MSEPLLAPSDDGQPPVIELVDAMPGLPAMAQCVLVQLDDPVPPRSEAAAAGFGTIADVTTERMRRAGERLRARSEEATASVDTGFRVCRLEPAR